MSPQERSLAYAVGLLSIDSGVELLSDGHAGGHLRPSQPGRVSPALNHAALLYDNIHRAQVPLRRVLKPRLTRVLPDSCSIQRGAAMTKVCYSEPCKCTVQPNPSLFLNLLTLTLTLTLLTLSLALNPKPSYPDVTATPWPRRAIIVSPLLSHVSPARGLQSRLLTLTLTPVSYTHLTLPTNREV